MKSKHVGCVPLLLAVLLLSSCGGDSTDGPTDNAKAPGSSPTPSATESKTPLPSASATPTAGSGLAGSGKLVTKPVPCTELSAPAGFSPLKLPPSKVPGTVVHCVFTSGDDLVAVSVRQRNTFTFTSVTGLQAFIKKNKKLTPRVFERTSDGWTFGAFYPDSAEFSRIDRYLVDSGHVLSCIVRVKGATDATTEAGSCNALRGVLQTS